MIFKNYPGDFYHYIAEFHVLSIGHKLRTQQIIDVESRSQKNINIQSGLSDLAKKNIGCLVKFAFQMKRIMAYCVYPHVIFGICLYFKKNHGLFEIQI